MYSAPATIPPRTPTPVTATNPPPALDAHDITRVTAAADAAKRRFPGSVGEYLANELMFVANTRLRFASGSLLHRVVNELLHPGDAV